jgi:hypothetical protein
MDRLGVEGDADVEGLQGLEHGLPEPGASISAATVTIDSAAMMVWLIPTTTELRDIGSRTFSSVWPRVDPSERAASTLSGGTERIACAVSRIAGGIE